MLLSCSVVSDAQLSESEESPNVFLSTLGTVSSSPRPLPIGCASIICSVSVEPLRSMPTIKIRPSLAEVDVGIEAKVSSGNALMMLS